MNSDPVSVSIMLSDFVICEQGSRKNSLIGCFNNFNVPQVPFATPLFFITVALTNLPPTTKKCSVVVRIEEPSSGNVLRSVGGELAFGEPSNLAKELVFEVSFPVPPFLIGRPGHYAVRVLVDNNEAGHRLFTVNTISAIAAPPQ